MMEAGKRRADLTRTFLGLAAFAVSLIAGISAAVAAPQDWEWGFQDAVSPIMHNITSFYDWLLVMMVAVSALVAVLMLIIFFKFNKRRNPEPSRSTHNTMLEIAWTTVPVLILVAIAIPSLRLLYYQETVPEADFTLKATGHQWYWSYEYPDHGGFGFDAVMVPDEDLTDGQLRLLTTDNQIVLPVGKVIRVLVTSEDVIHSWAMPPMGIKMDAVPGRTNEVWIEIDEPGTYYGQCSELCGQLHGFMPIMVHAVTEDEFNAWVAQEQAGLAPADAPAINVAASGLTGN
jgi:cytochrome c oxidase subunit 2